MQDFIPGVMLNHFPLDEYISPDFEPGLLTRLFPSLSFYSRLFLQDTVWAVGKAKKGECDDYAWTYASAWVLETVEQTGIRVHVDGLKNLDNVGPCVIVANHMSTLETFLLPAMIRPRFPVTFVVKRSLVEMPLFGHIMRSRNPIVVDRKNPREDLMKILNEGCEKLKQGTSIIVFPQSTRSLQFDETKFNTIGEKLARKAGVPLVPLALKTDAWGQGAHIKELGKINPKHDVLFRFFPPITIQGSGHAEHHAVIHCLSNTLDYWTKRQNAIDNGSPALPFKDPAFHLPEIER